MTVNTSQAERITERWIDVGAQVGIQRNRLFAAGGRINRTTSIPYWSWRPILERGAESLLIGSSNPKLLTT